MSKPSYLKKLKSCISCKYLTIKRKGDDYNDLCTKHNFKFEKYETAFSWCKDYIDKISKGFLDNGKD